MSHCSSNGMVRQDYAAANQLPLIIKCLVPRGFNASKNRRTMLVLVLVSYSFLSLFLSTLGLEKRYKLGMIRKRRNLKEIPIPKTEAIWGKNLN